MTNHDKSSRILRHSLFQLSLAIWLQFACIATARAQEATAKQELAFYPLDLCVNDQGVAYVVDRNLPGVWQRKDQQLTVFFKASPKFRTPLNAARCLACDRQGRLLVGDSSTRDIYRFNADGQPEPLTGGKIGIPMDIGVTSDGTLYVADLETRRLLRIPAGTSEVVPVAAVNPRGLYVDTKDQVWVISQDEQQLQIVSDDGKAEVIVDHRVFEFPHQVVVNAAGEAFISDGYKQAIWKVVRGSSPQIVFSGEPLVNPVGLALHEDRLVIVDPRARQVFRLSKENKLEPWFEIRQ